MSDEPTTAPADAGQCQAIHDDERCEEVATVRMDVATSDLYSVGADPAWLVVNVCGRCAEFFFYEGEGET